MLFPFQWFYLFQVDFPLINMCFVAFLRVWCSRPLAVSLYRWWQYLFKLGGNIPTCRFLGKGNKGKCKYKMQKQKQIQVQIYAWWQHHIQFGNNISACNKKLVRRACLDIFDKLLSLVWFSKKKQLIFFSFSPILSDFRSPSIGSSHRLPFISRTIHRSHYLQYCVPVCQNIIVF